MCNIEINPKATEATIEKAFKKASEQASCYVLFFHDVENAFFAVRNQKNGNSYNVTLCHIFDECIDCDCPEYRRNHFCKHAAMVIEEVQIREQEIIEEQKALWLDPGATTDRYAF